MRVEVPPHVFDDVCPWITKNSSRGACKSAPGYPPELLAYLYNKYEEKLPAVSGNYETATRTHGRRS